MKLFAVSALLAILAFAGSTIPSHAQEGVTETTVHFAKVAALEGPTAALGTSMNLGIRTAFEEANRAGA